LTADGLIATIKCYNRLDFRPFGVFEDRETYENNPENIRCFNTWSNFKAKLVPRDKIDMKLIEPVLNHIKEVWCSGDEGIYKYILSWFNVIFTNPSFKSKVAIILKSKEKQIGKGVVISDFLIPFVFGSQFGMSIAGLDTITARFNELVMNKLFINCDELSTLDGSYHQSFDVLKKRISDKTIKIEIKGGKSFIYPDFSNYVMCTNNDFAVKIEVGDARYLALQCSPIYKGNFKYFNDLSSTFTQKTGDHFLSYISYLEDIVEIRDIPLTQLKKEIIVMGLPSPTRFLLDLKEANSTSVEEEGGELGMYGFTLTKPWVKASILYDVYKEWCSINNERVVSSTKFGKEVKDYIPKTRKATGMAYDIDNISIEIK
jgi:hypothetical protein